MSFSNWELEADGKERERDREKIGRKTKREEGPSVCFFMVTEQGHHSSPKPVVITHSVFVVQLFPFENLSVFDYP